MYLPLRLGNKCLTIPAEGPSSPFPISLSLCLSLNLLNYYFELFYHINETLRMSSLLVYVI